MGSRCSHVKRQFKGEKGPAQPPRTCPNMPCGRYTQRDSAIGSTDPVQISIGVLDGVHIGATWQIRLNRPCAAAMRPCVKLCDNT